MHLGVVQKLLVPHWIDEAGQPRSPLPFGHGTISPDGRYPTTMVNYRTGGTPWFVVIDPAGPGDHDAAD
jgi:hypothetical protein